MFAIITNGVDMVYPRSRGEIVFLIIFFPVILFFYVSFKYPTLYVSEDMVKSTFYFFGKSPAFWYSTLYTFIVCYIAGKTLWGKKSPYVVGYSKELSSYQRKKWISIFCAQLIFYYFIPYILPWLMKGGTFFDDPYKPLGKDAYVYVYNGFTSFGGFLYIFVIIPILVWFFGKRYCSWFCSCGNLAETIGVTKWGRDWVKKLTPRNQFSKRVEWLQIVVLVFALVFGTLLFLDGWKIVAAGSVLELFWAIQHLVIDLSFGALIGVGFYPLMGTRIWCRYGCPLAQFMKIFGKFSKSRFKVVANEKCKGIGHCSLACPMGIDVASYAHRNKVAIIGSFSLNDTPCIGCGGCIDSCPVNALSFAPLKG